MIESEALVLQGAYREAIKEFKLPYTSESKKRVDEIRSMFQRILHSIVREHASSIERHRY